MYARDYLFSLGAVALLVALPSAGQAATAVPNFIIAGIPAPGLPHFENAANITLTKYSGEISGFQLDAIKRPGTSVSFQQPNVAPIDFGINSTFNLSVNFDAAGVFTGGSLSINGPIPDSDSNASSSLLFANVSAFNYDTTPDSTPAALGFKIDNFSGWANQFSSGVPESVYLYNFNVLGFMQAFSSPKFKTVTFAGSALTTVPVPAAFWLFGSALALMSGMRRKKEGAV